MVMVYTRLPASFQGGMLSIMASLRVVRTGAVIIIIIFIRLCLLSSTSAACVPQVSC